MMAWGKWFEAISEKINHSTWKAERFPVKLLLKYNNRHVCIFVVKFLSNVTNITGFPLFMPASLYHHFDYASLISLLGGTDATT